MNASKEKGCSLCKKPNDSKLFKLKDKFLDTALFNVIKNILSDISIELPLKYLICTECALALLQTEIVLKRLRKSFVANKNAETDAVKSTLSRTSNGKGSEHIAHEEEEEERDGYASINTRPRESTLGFDELFLDWKFYCTHCDYTSHKSKWYKRHLITKHQMRNPRIYQCPYCTESYQRVNAIRTHIDCEHGKKPRPTRQRRKTITFDSPTMPKSNSNDDEEISENSREESNLDDDQIEDANDPYQFECSLCEYETINPEVFKTHLGIKHQLVDSKIYKRKKCPCKFVRKVALENHIACKHEMKPRENTQRRKSVPPNYAYSTITCKEIEINDIKEEEKSEGNLRCVHCDYEAQNFGELKIHTVVSHQIDNIMATISLMDTKNDEVVVIETQNGEGQSNGKSVMDIPNGALEKNKEVPAMVTVYGYMEQSDDNQINLRSILKETINDEEEHSDEKDVTQTPRKQLCNPLNLRSSIKRTRNNDKEQSDDENVLLTPLKNSVNQLNSNSSSMETRKVTKGKKDEGHVFQTPQKIPPHQINANEISKTEWVFLCSYCDYESTKRKPYKEHMKNEHDLNDENIYKCLYCTESYEHYKSLKIHVTNMHCIDLTTMCDTPATYSDSSVDRQQTRQSPRKRKKSVESNNPKDSAYTDVSHEQPAKRKKGLSCVVCGKIFSSADKLQNHVNRLHSADEMCQ